MVSAQGSRAGSCVSAQLAPSGGTEPVPTIAGARHGEIGSVWACGTLPKMEMCQLFFLKKRKYLTFGARLAFQSSPLKENSWTEKR